MRARARARTRAEGEGEGEGECEGEDESVGKSVRGVLDLRVLVDEHKGVGHVRVSKVDQRRAHPRPPLGLGGVEELVHRARRAWRILDPLQALPSVALLVRVGRAQQVLLGEVPQPEHVVGDLAPQREGLQHERVPGVAHSSGMWAVG